jgi:hypothetical protein
MRWFKQSDRNHPKEIHHVLATEKGDSLPPALVEYWKRILKHRPMFLGNSERVASFIRGKPLHEAGKKSLSGTLGS